MTTENIDIRVREDGSRVVSRNLDDIANKSDNAGNAINRMNRSLAQVKQAGTSLQYLRDNIAQIDSFSSSMVQRFGANLSSYRSALMKHFEMISRDAKATAASIKSQMEVITAPPVDMDKMRAYYQEMEKAHTEFVKTAARNIEQQQAAENKANEARLKAATDNIVSRQRTEQGYTTWWNQELEKRLRLEQQFVVNAVKNLKTQEQADIASAQSRLRSATGSIEQRRKAEEAYTAWWLGELQKRDAASKTAAIRTAEQRSTLQAFNAERLDRNLIAAPAGTSDLARYYASQSGVTAGGGSALRTAEVQAMQRQAAMYSLLAPMVENHIAQTNESEKAQRRQVAAMNAVQQQHSNLSNATQQSTFSQLGWNNASRDGHALARGLSGALGSLWITYGALLPLLTGAALGSGFVQAAKSGAEFSYQLTFVKALGEETTASMGMLNDEALKLAKTSIYGPVELANGFRILAQAGLDAAQAVQVMPHVLNLATVGEMKMEDAAITLVGVLNAFNLSVNKSSHVGDVFAKAAAVSQTSVSSMTESMKYASTVGDQYKVSLEDTATALTVLAKNNIVGTAAGTAFRNMVKELYAPTKEAASYMEALGIKTSTASGQLRPFADVIYDLRGKIQGMTEIAQVDILQKIFGERGSKEAVAMLSKTREEWNKLRDSIANSDGFMDKVATQLNNEAKSKWKMALNTLQVELIKVFQELEGEFVTLADNLKNLFESPEFKEGVKSVVTGMVTVANAAVTLAPLLLDLAKAWIVFKAAQMGAGLMSLALGAASAFQAFAGSMLAASGAMGPVAAGMTATSAALRMIPHPLALIASLLTAGVAAWFMWGNSAETAADRSKKALKEIAEQANATGKLELEIARENLAAARDKYYSGNMSASSPERAEFAKWESAVQQLEAKEARIQARIKAATEGKPNSGLPSGSGGFTPPNPHEALQMFRDKLQSELELIQTNAKYEVQATERKYKNLEIAEVDSIQRIGNIRIAAHQKEIEKYLQASAKTKDVSDSKKYMNKASELANEIRLIQEASDDKVQGARLNHSRVMADIDKAYAKQALSEEDKFITNYTERWTDTLVRLALESNSSNESIAKGASDAMSKLQAAFEAGRARAALRDMLSEIRLTMTDIGSVINETEAAVERDGGWVAKVLGANHIQETINAMIAKIGPQLEVARRALEINPDDREMVQSYSQLKKEFDKYVNYVSPVWKETVKEIDSVFHDGFSKMFQKGKTNWSEFGKSLVSKFKTLVVDSIYQLLARPFVMNIVANVASLAGFSGLAGAAGSLSGAGNIAGLANNAYSVFNGGSSFTSGLYNSFATSSIGEALGLSAGAGMAAIGGLGSGVTAGAVGTGLSLAGGATGLSVGSSLGSGVLAGSTLTAGGSTAIGAGASALTSLGSTIGAALPWVGLGLAAVSLLGGSGLFGGGGAPKVDINTLFSGGSGGVKQISSAGGGESLSGAIYNDVVRSIVSKYAPDVTYTNYVGGHINTKGKSQNQNWAYASRIGQVGIYTPETEGMIYNNRNQDGGKGVEDWQKWAQEAIPKLQLAIITDALRQAGGGVKEIADSVMGTASDLTATLDAMSSTQITNTMEMLSGLIGVFEQLKLISMSDVTGDLAVKLSDVFGGYKQLSSTLTSYYSNYFTDEERKNNVVKDLRSQFEGLGMTMPKSREEFRRIVEGLDLTTDSGRKTFASLMQLQGAFASVTEAVKASSKSFVDTEAKREREIQLMELMGDKSAALAAKRQIEIQKLDGMNAMLQTYIYEMTDANDAVELAKENLKAAYENESSSLKEVIDRTKQAAKTFREFADSMMVGEQSPLSPLDQYNEARAQFQKTYDLAMAGDPDAQANLTKVAQQFLDVSKSYNATAMQYTTDFNYVRQAMERAAAAADSQTTIAQQTLDSINATVSGLNVVNTSVLSVKDAIAALTAALATQTAVKNQIQQVTSNSATSAITAAYLSELNRKPEQAGLTYWQNQVAGGASISDVVNAISNSSEAKVQDLYQNILGRAGDSEGVAYWTAQLNAGASVSDLTSLFQGSDEYKSLHGFANGGIFTNGIVSQPTLFNMAQMGEKDPEAIMPLVRTSSGLGVRVVSDGGGSTDGLSKVLAQFQEVAEELITELRAANTQRGAVAGATLEKLDTVAEGIEDVRKAIKSKA